MSDRHEPDRTPPDRRRSRDLAALLAVVAVVAAVYVPMLATGGRLADNDDFLAAAARHEAMRQSLFTYRTFPLRSHCFGSGSATLGDPEDPALNPLAWCLLPFPTVAALKVRFFAAAVVAAIGTFLLTRGPLRYTRWGAAFAGVVFPLAVWLPWQIDGGNTNEIYVGFVPLCLFLILTSRRRPMRFGLLVLLMVTMLSDGKLTCFAALLFMGLMCAAWSVFGWPGRETASVRARVQPLIWLVLAVGFTAVLGMARILPVLESGSVRRWVLDPSAAAWDPRAVWKWGPVQFPTVGKLAGDVIGVRLVSVGYTPLSVGLVPVLLFLAALVPAWRRVVPWAAVGLLFAWLTLGPNAPVNLLAVLNRLPLYKAFDDPRKYFLPFVAMSVCLGAGAFFGPLSSVRPRWVRDVAAAAATAGAVVALAPAAVRMSTRPFLLAPPGRAARATDDFYSVAGKGLPRQRAGPVLANAYFNLLRHVGTIDFYTPVPQPERGQPRYRVDADGRVALNPDYRGEAWFGETRNRCLARFEPTRIRLDIDLKAPDTLTINQNFDTGWRTDRGTLIEEDGLLALRLKPAGRYGVTLRYSSRAFTRGLVVSLCGGVLLVGFLGLRMRFGSSSGGPPVLAHGRVGGSSVSGQPSPKAASPAPLREPLRGVPAPRAAPRRVASWVLVFCVAVAVVPSLMGALAGGESPLALATRPDRYTRRTGIDDTDDAYRRATWANEDSAEHHYNLALRLEAEGDLTGAMPHYREVLRRRPRDASAHIIVGRAWMRSGALDAALRHFRSAAELDPTDPRARQDIRRLLALQGRAEEAGRE